MYYFVILSTIFLLNISVTFAQDQIINDNENPTDTINDIGDIDRGEAIFFRCRACHDIERNIDNDNVGPNLHGIFGRQAGSLETYDNYSKALKDAAFIWDEAELDNWLKNPNGFLPGNTMAFSGILRQKDREDIISFIKHEGKN